MQTITRRDFLRRGSAGLAAAAGLSAASGTLRAAGANDKIILGIIGVGGRGNSLALGFALRPDCEIAYLCDVDPRRGQQTYEDVQSTQQREPRRVSDYRAILDDRAVDAVVVATPDHWHALPTIHACQAGKDVYVEKPASHNIWEGRKMVEAARRYGRIVQVGTQSRSAPYIHKALEYIRSGALGRIHLCRVCNLKSGDPYREPAPSPLPAGVDYDRWLGPAPARPFDEGHFHTGWYYHWDYCGGDMGNDSSHQLDLARWLIGKDYPRSVHCCGGNFAFDDDREVPDTQVAHFEFDDLVLTFELTQWAPYMAKTSWEIRNGDLFPLWLQNSTRIELYGTRALMLMGRHGGGWQAFTGDGAVAAQEYGRFPDEPHKESFVQSIRTRQLPPADIEEGHRSAILTHLGNISYRLGGRKLRFDAARERFEADDEANQLLTRAYREPYVIPDPA